MLPRVVLEVDALRNIRDGHGVRGVGRVLQHPGGLTVQGLDLGAPSVHAHHDRGQEAISFFVPHSRSKVHPATRAEDHGTVDRH